MEENIKVSLCITTYNRPKETIESFWNVRNENRLHMIYVLDDHSGASYYNLGANIIKESKNISVKTTIISNEQNLGMSRNKAKAISLSKTDWCIILDSDNKISPDYIDAIYKLEEWNKHTIYCPSFAMPNFDYRRFEGMYFDRENIKPYLTDKTFLRLLNTCNYFVNKNEYAKVYEYNPEIKGADTIWFNYLWLKAGNGFYVVPNCHYEHAVHPGSGWQQNLHENRKKANEIKELIFEL